MEGGREGGKTEGKEDQKDEDVSLGRRGVGLSMLAHLSVVQTNSSEFSKIHSLSAIPDSSPNPSFSQAGNQGVNFFFTSSLSPPPSYLTDHSKWVNLDPGYFWCLLSSIPTASPLENNSSLLTGLPACSHLLPNPPSTPLPTIFRIS